MSSSPRSISSLEERIAAIEKVLGCSDLSSDNSSSRVTKDVESTLTRLTTSNASIPKAIVDDLNECDRLEELLNPGSILTYQSNASIGSRSKLSSDITKPVLYRREEILTSAKEMKDGMDHLSQIRDLLLLSAGGKEDKEADYTNAPIMSCDNYLFTGNPSVRRRLQDVTVKTATMLERVQIIARRVDALVGRYHRVMSAASEKLVLFDEELASKEQATKD
mmetsp:Transcript_6611/g.9658  ORF Transcript_6611/g.9658 Transcript_6611/m.9658 type:complete len:221 (-) Transcript_6611:578-1240(-)